MKRMEERELDAVRRAQAGDQDAFRTLVELHGRKVFGLAYRITREEASAEDVVQETFIKAHRALRTYDGRAAFGTWLYRIAANAAIETVRRRNRRTAHEAPFAADGPPDGAERGASSEPGPERRAAGGEARRAVRAAMSELTTLERAAFVLRHYEGRSTAEISAVLGLAPGASRHAVFRAVKKLRRALQPLMTPGPEVLS